MGGLRRKPIPPGNDDEIVRALARSSSPLSRHVRQFLHAGKPYIAYQGAAPAFKPGTLVATGYALSVVADGHTPSIDEVSAALLAFEGRRQGQQ